MRLTHREVYDPAPGRLITFEVEDLWFIPAPAVCYERYADSASPEKPACPHLIDMLQARPNTFGRFSSLAYGQQSSQRQT